MFIAIIAILAATLFPVFARARENARNTTCLANVKQMGLGIMQYAQDYDEVLPLDGTHLLGSNNYPVALYWDLRLDPYIESNAIFKCPSAAGGPRNYRHNAYRGGSHNSAGALQPAPTPHSLALITTPSNTVLLVDMPSICYLNSLGGWSFRAETDFLESHFGGANFGMADGHAKWCKAPAALYTGGGWLAAQGWIM